MTYTTEAEPGRKMTGDEYVALLDERRAEWVAERSSGLASSWVDGPLLEWFVRPGDEALVELPAPRPAPLARPAAARCFRTAASLREERDQLQSRLDRMSAPVADPAVVNLSPRSRNAAARVAGRRRFAALDRDVARAARLVERIRVLDGRIRTATAREARDVDGRT